MAFDGSYALRRGSFQWFKNKFGKEEARLESEGGPNAYDALTEAAAQVSPGSEGCLFLPYCRASVPRILILMLVAPSSD